jgi:hypothetical protein
MCLTGFTGSAKRRAGGFVLVNIAISATVLLAIIGLAIDTGYLQLVKTRMQAAADAAAVGGVQEIKLNGAANVVTAAKADAALNGFTDGVNSVTVTVNSPPASGSYTSSQTGVEVIVSQNVGTLFMQLLNTAAVDVRARAVARQGPGTNCLYALSPSAASAFSATGGVNVNIAGGVMVDSNSATALSVTNGAVVTAASITVVGNYPNPTKSGASITPTPVTGASAVADPLAYVTPPPATGACLQTNYSIGNGKSATLSPGIYCNGISIAGGATVGMKAGNYILRGGGLTVSNGATLSGTGVTFYNTQATGYAYGAISLLGGVDVQLTAPTTGSLAGILFFQDRSVVSSLVNTFSNGSTSTFTGSLYFPSTALSYTGGASGSYTIIVAKTVSFSGGVTVKNDYSSLPGGSPILGNATLSE